ncbi:sulfotransferase [Sphaerisporangium rufum]|uniref:Sulfotransferase n=1 Tax=Sphaerisporangium rufum TaxID=1381558 RepID=A0A919V2T0_9ACTN|nr:sulfotransferase [Sphaerisporangium rufum]GII75600.1 sulfotransferase [Sphaerisporangium rufum]
MRPDRPIFVVGCPRSGTTLLQLMLHAHRRIAVPPETRFLTDVYYHRRLYGDMRRPENRRRLAERIATDRSTRFHELGVARAGYVRAAVEGPGSLGSVLGAAFAGYAARFERPRWGDKRPAYVRHVDALRRLFPDAQFVHLVRDGRDCVASLKEMPWYPMGVLHAISTWAEAVDFGRRHARRLPAGTYHMLRYEDLTADPEGELGRLCAFLGEDFDPAMCEPRRVAAVAVPPRKVWHRNTLGEVTPVRVGSWAGRLAPWEIALCEEVLGERLRAHGYEPAGGGAGAAPGDLAAYRRVAAHRRLARYRQQARDWLSRRREPGPLAALPAGPRPQVRIPQQRTAARHAAGGR